MSKRSLWWHWECPHHQTATDRQWEQMPVANAENVVENPWPLYFTGCTTNCGGGGSDVVWRPDW